MKRMLIALMVLSFAVVAVNAAAADLTGVITETKCGAPIKQVPKDISCIKKCVTSDAGKLALLVGDKLYTITNPKKAAGHEGHTVTVTGETDEDAKTITIDTLAMAK
jgi:hypothetical protein